MTVVLDASAILALIGGEPGAEAIGDVLEDAAISAANLSEVVSKLTDWGLNEGAIVGAVTALPLQIHALDATQAWRAGLLRSTTRARGLSLGDRACLALAETLDAPAMTMDRAWSELALDVEVVLGR